MPRKPIVVTLLLFVLAAVVAAQVVPTRTVSGTRVRHYKDGAVPVDLSPGIINPGQTYVFRITANFTPGVNVSQYPYTFGQTRAFAEVVSGMMQP